MLPSRRDREDSLAGDRAHVVRGLVPWRRATPRRLARLAVSARRHGRTVAGLVAAAAIRDGRAVGLFDDDGALTYDELDRRASTVAGELHGRGVLHAGHGLGILCRNGRGLIVTLLAASRLGADVVMLPPTIDGPSLAAVLRNHHLHVVAHDEAFTEILASARFRGQTIVADRSAPGQLNVRDLELLPQADAPIPERPGRIISAGSSPDLDRTEHDGHLSLRHLPIARGATVLITAPLAQRGGLAALAAAILQECPAVVTAQPDDESVRSLVEQHGVALIVPAEAG